MVNGIKMGKKQFEGMTVKQQNWTLFENTEELRETTKELRDMFSDLPCAVEEVRLDDMEGDIGDTNKRINKVWAFIILAIVTIAGIAYKVSP